MMGKLLPVIFVILGLAIGGGAGFFLRPAPPPPEEVAEGEAAAAATGETHATAEEGHGEEGGEEGVPTSEFVKLNNQFVVPLLDANRVRAMVIMSLSIEMPVGGTERVYAVEPRLRDSFLQVLFDHANNGGFEGVYTSTDKMAELRRALLENARSVVGPDVKSILISDILRQDS
ncbi:flagellar basal body-associated FliL family protein [Thioclava litoralis]|uniref:Flagellar basal body-associated FliL family protein n=2 Tax=Thioclava TaxID=285107 RepID=A0ABZ1DXK7_9RHOB|nr:flagellar basal body-associated FliL family protein [Thioclava sp. FTW29]